MPKKLPMGNINRVKRPKPKGGYYLYHRLTGAKLPDNEGTPEFAIAWANEELKARRAAEKATLAAEIRMRDPKQDPGSYWSLCQAFQKGDAWAAIGDLTRRDYLKVMDWMGAQGADGKQAADLVQARAETLLDRAIIERGYRQGIMVLQFNRRLYNWVLARAVRQKTWGNVNPWVAIELPEPPARPEGARKMHRPWKPWEVIEVLFAAPLGLRRAFVLGACGCDSKTAAGIRWEQYAEVTIGPPLKDGDEPQTAVGFDMNRGKTDTESFLIVPEILRMFLDENAERPADTVASSIPGDPFTERGLQKRSSDFLIDLAGKGTVGEGLTFHGLRHTIGKAVAESNGTLHAIQGALQHKSPSMALYYSAQADKRRALAAVSDGLDQWFVQNRTSGDCKTLN